MHAGASTLIHQHPLDPEGHFLAGISVGKWRRFDLQLAALRERLAAAGIPAD